VNKSSWLGAAAFLLCFVPVSARADDLDKVERSIAKEPAYTGKPRYALLVFGPMAKDRVWLVQDGGVLYVDRRGNGNLTDPGCRVVADKDSRSSSDGQFTFDAADLSVGGRIHKGLAVGITPLKEYADESAEVKTPLTRDSNAVVASITLDVDMLGLNGGGIGGRVRSTAGSFDLAGVLVLGDSPANAPIIHFGGPLEVTFYRRKPSLRLGRPTDMVLVLGTPGAGPGAFAMIHYDYTIPDEAKPVAEITYPSSKPGGAPVAEKFELKGRC
jgi:hypothetical protein